MLVVCSWWEQGLGVYCTGVMGSGNRPPFALLDIKGRCSIAPTKKGCSKAREEAAHTPWSQQVRSGQPQSLPPELQQSFYELSKPIKAGISISPFSIPTRYTHFFPHCFEMSCMKLLFCQGISHLTRNSKA